MEDGDDDRSIMIVAAPLFFIPPGRKEDILNLAYQEEEVGRKLQDSISIPVWTQLGADIDGEAFGDIAGNSVSLSSDGSVLAVGARQYNGGNGIDMGHVRVFKYYANNTWIQLGADVYGDAAGDNFGYSASLSSDGSVLAVGAPFNDGNAGVVDRGHVRVFKYYANNTWIQLGAAIRGEAAGDSFGCSVSLSSDGGVLAVGAWNNDGNGNESGHVRVFKYYVNNTWIRLGADIDGEAAGDISGRSVSLSSDGSVLAVGAVNNDGNAGIDMGHVRVFKYYVNNTWIQLGADIDGEAAGDMSGYSVSLSSDGSVLAVGAPGNHAGSGSYTGHVRVFSIQVSLNTNWRQ